MEDVYTETLPTPETEVSEDEFRHLIELGLDFPFHIEKEVE
jgi:hypothetical protein